MANSMEGYGLKRFGHRQTPRSPREARLITLAA